MIRETDRRADEARDDHPDENVLQLDIRGRREEVQDVYLFLIGGLVIWPEPFEANSRRQR